MINLLAIWFLLGLFFCVLMTELDYNNGVDIKKYIFEYVLTSLLISTALGPFTSLFYLYYKNSLKGE